MYGRGMATDGNEESQRSGPPRRRPATRGGRPTLTRERIVQEALEIAGQEGFPAVTMRALAQRLGVTVAALYRHVPDRQAVVDQAAALFAEGLPEHRYDPDADWRDAIRTMYRELRDAYRRHPRAILVAIDEDLTPSSVPDSHVERPERMVEFLCDLGLDLPDALAVREQYLLDVFGFVLLVDHRHDHGPGWDVPMTPGVFLDDRPHLSAPRLDTSREVLPSAPDDLFEVVVDNAITLVEAMLGEGRGRG
jgi:AcrR family transcriptional regulator